MILETWLKERLDTTNVEEINQREFRRLGVSDRDLRASPQWVEKWREFISQKRAEDELWFFESPPETWAAFAGTSGYALVRSGHVIAHLVSSRN